MEMLFIAGGIIVIISLFTILYIMNKPQSSNDDTVQFFKNRITELESENANLRMTHIELEKSNARCVADLHNMTKQLQDWETTKKTFMQNAETASLKASQDVTKHLLEQHQKQNQVAVEESQKAIDKRTKELYGTFQDLFTSMDKLKTDLAHNNTNVDTIKRALSSSSQVGYAAETALENALKSFGLIENQDFTTQMHVHSADGALRPDAVVFLPGDNALVIDSKASKFIMELAIAEQNKDSEAIKTAYANLKRSMNNHLTGLTNKAYSKAIYDEMKKHDKESTIGTITTLMWLPNDAAVEKLRQADPTFPIRSSAANIHICGPTGLWTAIGIGSQKVQLEKQAKNHIKIREEIEKMLTYIATLVEKGNKLERGLTATNTAWSDFSKSFNARFLSSAKRMESLGVSGKNNLIPMGKDKDVVTHIVPNTPEK